MGVPVGREVVEPDFLVRNILPEIMRGRIDLNDLGANRKASAVARPLECCSTTVLLTVDLGSPIQNICRFNQAIAHIPAIFRAPVSAVVRKEVDGGLRRAAAERSESDRRIRSAEA